MTKLGTSSLVCGCVVGCIVVSIMCIAFYHRGLVDGFTDGKISTQNDICHKLTMINVVRIQTDTKTSPFLTPMPKSGPAIFVDSKWIPWDVFLTANDVFLIPTPFLAPVEQK